ELERRGWKVYTIDDFHKEEDGAPERHLRGSWSSQKLNEGIWARWAGTEFSALVLDFFYLPGVPYLERYIPPSLFRNLIPLLADPNTFGVRSFFLPNDPMGHTVGLLKKCKRHLEAAGLGWRLVADPLDNPLYAATAALHVDRALRALPNPRFNENMAIYTSSEARFVHI
ncbi:unnamed protein product, partial [Phaeothamnion confervicola]